MKSLPDSENNKQKIISQLKLLSNLLDEAITIPGSNYRIGIDPILGLFPGVGDYLGTFLSGYILFQSTRLGVGKATLLSMTTNILTEMLVGIIPVLGDFFDVTWKANKRNMILLFAHLDNPQETEKASLLLIIVLFTGLFFVLIITSFITFLVLQFLWKLLF